MLRIEPDLEVVARFIDIELNTETELNPPVIKSFEVITLNAESMIIQLYFKEAL